MADYPDLYPFVKVSVRKSFKKGNTSAHNLPSALDRAAQDRRSASRTQARAVKRKTAPSWGERAKRKGTESAAEPAPSPKRYIRYFMSEHKVESSFSSSFYHLRRGIRRTVPKTPAS